MPREPCPAVVRGSTSSRLVHSLAPALAITDRDSAAVVPAARQYGDRSCLATVESGGDPAKSPVCGTRPRRPLERRLRPDGRRPADHERSPPPCGNVARTTGRNWPRRHDKQLRRVRRRRAARRASFPIGVVTGLICRHFVSVCRCWKMSARSAIFLGNTRVRDSRVCRGTHLLKSPDKATEA